jgi:hypothetical protein
LIIEAAAIKIAAKLIQSHTMVCRLIISAVLKISARQAYGACFIAIII